MMQDVVGHDFNPTLGRKKPADLYEPEASLVYTVNSRPTRAT